MEEEYKPLPLVTNEAIHHLELAVDGHTAFIDWQQGGAKVWLIHTEAPAALEGEGVATALSERTLAYLDEHHSTRVPLCPLVHAYLKRPPEWERLLDPSVKPF